MSHPFARLLLTTTLLALLTACAPDSAPESAKSTTQAATPAPEAESTPTPTEDLTEQVARMGAIGYSTGGGFSPDRQRIAFITNASGVPNVWMANVDGSDLKQVTHSEDQVNGVSWNPVNDTLAVDISRL